jgi:WD40 repeat protein
MKGHEKAVWSVAFSPDGITALSGGGDEVLRQYLKVIGSM